MDDYIAEPGALWEEAWVERAEVLLDLAVEIPRDREDYGGPAFEYLSQALAEVPSQSERVRAAATEFLAEIDALGGVARPWTCTSSCRTEAIPSQNSPSR